MVNSAQFWILITRSYSSHPFLCALGVGMCEDFIHLRSTCTHEPCPKWNFCTIYTNSYCEESLALGRASSYMQLYLWSFWPLESRVHTHVLQIKVGSYHRFLHDTLPQTQAACSRFHVIIHSTLASFPSPASSFTVLEKIESWVGPGMLKGLVLQVMES